MSLKSWLHKITSPKTDYSVYYEKPESTNRKLKSTLSPVLDVVGGDGVEIKSINLEIILAEGGVIVKTVRAYDPKLDRRPTKLYLIHSHMDVAEAVGNIVKMEIVSL